MGPAGERRPGAAGGPPAAAGRLRIAFLDSWARSRARGSGSTVAIDGLAHGLEALGHRVRRIEPRASGGRTLTRLAFNATLPFRFRAEVHDLTVGFDLDGCFLPSSGPTPRVTALKGILADEKRFEQGATRLRFQALSRLERRAARSADRVVVTSRYCRRVAVDAYDLDAGSVAVVPEGIDPGPWEEVAERRREGRDGSSADGRDAGPVVLSVARQYPRKNTVTLLRAFLRVRAEVPGARLRVVGGGPRLPALRRLARELGVADGVRLLGEVEDLPGLRAEYGRADVFCLPSLQEGFGIVFLEAMASGLPVVAGDAAAVPVVVPDGEAGILVPPRRAGEVASALVRLLRDPGLRRRMGEAGRRHVRRFTWPEVARRFLDAVPTPDGRADG